MSSQEEWVPLAGAGNEVLKIPGAVPENELFLNWSDNAALCVNEKTDAGSMPASVSYFSVHPVML